jgi:hypothetical protein
MPEKPGVAGVQELRNETAAFRSVDLASGRFEASICSRLGYLHPEPCNSRLLHLSALFFVPQPLAPSP